MNYFDPKNITNWVPIGQHTAIGAVIALVGGVFIGPWIIPLNAAGWFGRELWQRWKDQPGQPLHPKTWTFDKHLQWIAPTLVGLIALAVT